MDESTPQSELLLGLEHLVVDVVLEGFSELALLGLFLQLHLGLRAAAALHVLILILGLIPFQTDIRAGVCGSARRQLHSCRRRKKTEQDNATTS